MCGICGVVKTSTLDEKNRGLVLAMNGKLKQRGPDSEGHYNDNNVSFAMRRLSIIDLESGDQPLYNEDRKLVLVANGEIYNFIELRNDLVKRGHSFKSKSDCEVIIHLYEEYGANFMQYLRGMFSFALYDKKKNKVILARDRMGEKPLYFIKKGDEIIFASEMKAISLAIDNYEVDLKALDFYLTRLCFNEGGTLIKQVKKILPGFSLTFNLGTGETLIDNYWDPLKVNAVIDDPVNEVRRKLNETMSIIIRSDVPVGVSLSGGLDSSAMAVLCKKNINSDMKAFSVGYPGEPDFDERRYARNLANEYKLELIEDEIKVSDFVNDFVKLVYYMDDPVADISAYAYYRVMALARKNNVPVIISGFGGDELFWGYPWVAGIVKYANDHYIHPSFVTRFLDMVNGNSKRMKKEHIFCLRRIMFQRNQKIFRNLYKDKFRAALKSVILPAQKYDDGSNIQGIIINELFKYWLFPNLNVLGDRLSMASSVEMRLPFLDFKLVETVLGIYKAHPKYHLNPPKALLKKVLENDLPRAVIDRKKRGFQPPVREWQEAVVGNFKNIVDNGYLVRNDLINLKIFNHLVDTRKQDGVNYEYLYRIILFELWYRQVVQKEAYV